MNREFFYRGIGLSAQAAEAARDCAASTEVLSELTGLFFRNPPDFYAAVKSHAGYRRLFLRLYLDLAISAHEGYRMREIDDSVYFDTFHDIVISCENCAREFGDEGIDDCEWLARHVRLSIFRLGRLQFEPIPLPHGAGLPGRFLPQTEPVLGVHIPRGSALTEADCLASYRAALSFFRGVSPVFHCSSWLLYPGLSKVLPESSHILSFARRYLLYEVDENSRQAEERIFLRVLEDPAGYSQSTSLQVSAREYLLRGGRLGSARGLFYLEDRDGRASGGKME